MWVRKINEDLEQNMKFFFADNDTTTLTKIQIFLPINDLDIDMLGI